MYVPWRAIPANDRQDVDAGEWTCFRVVNHRDEWLAFGGKAEMQTLARYVNRLAYMAHLFHMEEPS